MPRKPAATYRPDTINFKITHQVVSELMNELERLPNIPPYLRTFRAELEVAKLNFTRGRDNTYEVIA